MKHIYFSLTISILLSSCETESELPDSAFITFDTVCPIIELAGNSNDTAYLFANYADPGAELREKIKESCLNIQAEITGTVDTRFPGTYLLRYNGKDKAGNRASTITRTVTVIENKAGFLNGSYDVTCTCSAITKGILTPTISLENYTATISTGTINSHFELSALKIGSEYVQPLRAWLSDNSINLKYYIRDHDIRGTTFGPLSASKNTFTIESTVSKFSPSITYFCKNVYSKQLVLH